MYKFFLVVICVCATISSSCAWNKSSFFVNSKLPNQCGHAKSYNPENAFEGWGVWPWMGILVFDTTYRCPCVLIHPQVVITGLYGIKWYPEVALKDLVYVTFSLPGLPSFQNISVTEMDFTGTYNSDDFVMAKLEKPVIISSQVQPICLWEELTDWDQQIRHHVGMMIGSDLENIYNINELRFSQSTVKVVSLESCEKENGLSNKNSTIGYGICFVYINEPKVCHSIGSPMMMPRLADDGKIVWYLRGLLIYRAWFCTRKRFKTYPRAFDVGLHRKWIESHFKPSVKAGCGRRVVSHTPLITQGTETIRGDFPWHAAIYHKRGSAYQCGGSLISSNIVLTAAHCTVNRNGVIPASTFFILLGKYALNEDEPGSKRAYVAEVIPHEMFNKSSLLNDIALLKLTEEVEYNEYIQPGCLWDETDTNKENILNHMGTVVGWGYTEENKVSNELKSAVIPVKDDIICFQSHANFYNNFLHDKTFCAGNPRGNGTNVCNGDSGGSFVLPIIQPDQEVTWFIRGIVSVAVPKAGLRICDPDYYAVYTDVSKYTKWINSHLV